MILEFNNPHALNFGEDFNYISTYVNRDIQTPTIEDYRILVEGVKSGEQLLLFINKMDNFFGKSRYRIEYIDGFKVTPTFIRNKGKDKTYVYHNIGHNTNHVEDMLDAWKKSDPMVHMGNLTHQFISKANGYTWAYRFNNKTY